MTTDTGRAKFDPSRINCASGNSASDVNRDFNYGAPADVRQILGFLNFTLKESIIQTVKAFIQSLRCTYLLVSELHRPFLDSVPHGMDRRRRSSLLPAPRLPFRKRPVISAPIGPVQHNGRVILPSRPVTTSKISGNYIFGEVVSGGRKDVKPESKRPPTPIVGALEDSTPRQLSKSRTFNVFSGITASFSRSSLASSRRNTASSNGSSASLAPAITADTSRSKTPTSSRLPISKSGRVSLGSHKMDLHLTRDPCCIYTDQPSAYWSGRFTSLHDKFLAECLTPNNLQSLLGAKSDRSTALKKKMQPSIPQESQYTRFDARLPPSATSAAILQQMGGGGGLNGHMDEVQSSEACVADAKLLLDDDERCRRVFIHLEAYCATEEARRSLFAFQQDFARKERRPKLLPKGGTMGDRNLGSYISRMGVYDQAVTRPSYSRLRASHQPQDHLQAVLNLARRTPSHVTSAARP
ncbi:hypothetical protein KVR01_000359 [Diaporthe batatas]|uniref:uncharacterized protein n=1 Tax=Diaporthe batatas TaxID=748121 RepID=UPI001D050CD4|nr:uncharacterized protein KVR01_000359 [Diaporthe batatas]KAG8169614.1 hypothetical protein KVR01_000359 [Diaporthe batatas]